MLSCLIKYIVLIFCLVLVFSVQAQKHEVGVQGGWLYGYPYGKTNSRTMHGGWNVGGYYRYTLNKWVGAESGLDYTRKKFEFEGELWENSLSVPLNVVVFPKFRFSLFGGIYFKNRLGTNTLSKTIMKSDGLGLVTIEYSSYQVEKKPVWGYTVGAKWNMKYCRLVISCKQDMTSWIKDFHKVWDYEGWIVKPYKSFSLNLTAEIPLWRKKQKHEVE